MKHLTDQSLIDYRFNLLEAELAAEVARHLAGCDQCQRRAAELAKRLDALDLLKQEPALTEDLVRQTLDSVRRIRSTTRFRDWWAAAAAVVLAATAVTLWLQWGAGQRPGSTSPVVMEKAEERLSTYTTPTSLQPTTNNQQPITTDAQSEPPPFAPASAIELVVLPRRQSVQLTIYNSADLTLVRDRRSLTLKKGWNWLQFMWANTLIDPTSLDLEPQGHKDAIRVEQLVYPAGLKEIGRWLIWSEVEGQVPFEITYFTSGVSWRAFYEGILSADTRSMHLKGYVRVTNDSGEDYENAQVRLVVGKVHLLDQIADLARREYPYRRPQPPVPASAPSGALGFGGRRAQNRMDAKSELEVLSTSAPMRPKEITKEGVSEYFLYTVEGTETIPNGWSKRLVSMEANDVPVVNLFKYEKERYGDAVVRFLSFKNDKEHRLGQTPIPDGEVKVYRTVDDASHLSYVGSAGFKYVPVGQEVELNLGEVREVVVESTLMEYKTEQHQFDSNRDVSGWDEVQTFKVQVRNTCAVPVQVEVKQDLPTTYWDLTRTDAIGTYERVDADTIKFTLDLTTGSRQSFEYRLRTYHGTREQDWKSMIAD